MMFLVDSFNRNGFSSCIFKDFGLRYVFLGVLLSVCAEVLFIPVYVYMFSNCEN